MITSGLVIEALAVQAFDLRDSPYFADAVEALVEKIERLPLLRYEQRQQRNAWLVRLLQETDPDRVPRRVAA